MRFLHTLDPDDLLEMDFYHPNDYFKSVAELEKEDRAMEKYYERKNTK